MRPLAVVLDHPTKKGSRCNLWRCRRSCKASHIFVLYIYVSRKESAVDHYIASVALLTWPPPGSVVSAPLFVLFRHRGIVSDRWCQGKPIVISNSARAGGVTEESWAIFSGGQTVTPEGYPSTLLPYEVLRRARSCVGRAYNPLVWNCDHLTRYAHGLEPQSPQVAATLLISLLAIGVTAARRA